MSGEQNWGEPTNDVAERGRTPSPSRNRARSRSPERRQNDQQQDRGRPAPQAGGNPGNNLHVSGLSNRVEEHHLETAFAKFGTVTKAQVMRDPHSREPRGFAFVTMSTGEEAEAAMGALNATDLEGKVITIERARRGRARTPTPGAYHGPPKREPYGGGRDSGRYDDRDRYYGGSGRDSRYDDRRGGYDDRRGGYDDRRDDRYGYAQPMRDDRDRGGRGGYDDRSYDDRRGGSSRSYDDYDRRRY